MKMPGKDSSPQSHMDIVPLLIAFCTVYAASVFHEEKNSHVQK